MNFNLSEVEVDGYEAWKLYGHPEYWDDPNIMNSILQDKKYRSFGLDASFNKPLECRP